MCRATAKLECSYAHDMASLHGAMYLICDGLGIRRLSGGLCGEATFT